MTNTTAETTQPAASQEAAAVVSGETFNDDGTSDIIKPSLPIGTKLYATPVAAATVEQSPTKPLGCDVCPVTGLRFYDNMEHPERGMIAMYGGPFDVYSIPELDTDGEFRRERFDLDRDDWVEGGEPLGYFYHEQQPEAVSTPAAPGIDLRSAILKLRDDALHMKDPGDTVNAYNRVLPLIDASPKSGSDALQWAVSRWNAEVCNRPLVNVHRRSLDDAWRQVIRHLGGDDVTLCGPRHDDLLATMQATSAEVGA